MLISEDQTDSHETAQLVSVGSVNENDRVRLAPANTHPCEGGDTDAPMPPREKRGEEGPDLKNGEGAHLLMGKCATSVARYRGERGTR